MRSALKDRQTKVVARSESNVEVMACCGHPDRLDLFPLNSAEALNHHLDRKDHHFVAEDCLVGLLAVEPVRQVVR
jgi:hypothetical protein